MLCAGRGPFNRKCSRRLDQLDRLRLSTRIGRRKQMRLQRGQVCMPSALRQRCSSDLVHDQLLAGQQFRILAAIAQLNRAIPLPQITGATPAQRVAECLERHVKLGFIRPGKRIEIGHIESFNGCARNQCLNVVQLISFDDFETTLRAWRVDQSPRPANDSQGYLRPSNFPPNRQTGRIKKFAEPQIATFYEQDQCPID